MENIYDTSVLVQVVPNLKTSQNWLLDRFLLPLTMSALPSNALSILK